MRDISEAESNDVGHSRLKALLKEQKRQKQELNSVENDSQQKTLLTEGDTNRTSFAIMSQINKGSIEKTQSKRIQALNQTQIIQCRSLNSLSTFVLCKEK
jgi:hypothetical protein